MEGPLIGNEAVILSIQNEGLANLSDSQKGKLRFRSPFQEA